MLTQDEDERLIASLHELKREVMSTIPRADLLALCDLAEPLPFFSGPALVKHVARLKELASACVQRVPSDQPLILSAVATIQASIDTYETSGDTSALLPAGDVVPRLRAALNAVPPNYLLEAITYPAVRKKRGTAKPSRRKTIEEEIINLLDDKKLTGKVIAHRCGRASNEHFRRILSGMVKKGLIRNDHDNQGYYNPNRHQTSLP